MVLEHCQQCGDPLQDGDDRLCKACEHFLTAAAEAQSVRLAVRLIRQHFTKAQIDELVRELWWNRER